MQIHGNSLWPHITSSGQRSNAGWPVSLTAINLAFLLVALAALSAYLFGLFRITPFGYTEGLYAEIGRGMLQYGHWIVPHLDGGPYIEKPPLLYWLEAASFMLFGVHIWAARLVSVIAALGACLSLWSGLRRLIPQQSAICAVLILASSPGWILMAHVATFDMLLAATVSMSLMAFMISLEGGHRYWTYWGWLAAALAFFAKGPVGPVLIALVLVIWLLASRQPGKLRRLFRPLGVAIFILLVGSWSLAAALRQPGFLYQFFWVEQFGRFFGTRIPKDYSTGPWWFYLPWLLAGSFPWCLALLPAGKRPGRYLSPEQLRISRFGLVWTTVIVLFFSFSKDKAAQYLLPALPGLAIAVGPLVAHWLKKDTRIGWRQLAPFAGLFLMLPPLVYASGIHLPDSGWIAIASCAAAGIVCLILIRFGYRVPALKTGVFAIFLLAIALVSLEIPHGSHRTLARVAETIRQSPHPGAPLVFFRHYDPFAMLTLRLRRRPWIYAAHSSELFFAEKTQPRRFPFITGARLTHLLSGHGAWLVATYRDRQKLAVRLPRDCPATQRTMDNIVLAYLPKGCTIK